MRSPTRVDHDKIQHNATKYDKIHQQMRQKSTKFTIRQN